MERRLRDLELEVKTLKAQLVLYETKAKITKDNRLVARNLLIGSVFCAVFTGLSSFGLIYGVAILFYIFSILTSLLLLLCLFRLTKENE